MNRPKTVVAYGVLVFGFCAGTVLAHGFAVPPSAGAGFGTGGGSPTTASGRTTPVGPSAPSTPAAAVPNKNAPPAGATNRGGAGAGRATGGRVVGNSGAATADASPSSPSAIAAGAQFRAQLIADAALVKDRSILLEASCFDAALRRVDLRIKMQELRASAAETKRRIDVEAKVESTWEHRETWLMKDAAGSVTLHRWTRDAGLKKVVGQPAEIGLAGTAIMMSDVIPFDPSSYSFAFKRAAEVDFVPQETYTLKVSDDSPARGIVTYRSDLRCPTHMELSKSSVRTRAYDWSGWRYVSGTVVPSRIAVLGASLEPVASMEVREANVNTALKADVFDPAKLGGGEMVSAGR